MVLTSRVMQSVIRNQDFRRLVPEWTTIYASVDARVAAKKKRGRCSSCGLLRGQIDVIKRDLAAQPKLADRVREYFRVSKLDVVRKCDDGKTRVITVSQQTA